MPTVMCAYVLVCVLFLFSVVYGLLFFFIVKDCKISLLVVKDFLFIVEMLQKNYDIVVEDIEGKIGNIISKRTLEKSLVEMATKKNSVNYSVLGAVEYFFNMLL